MQTEILRQINAARRQLGFLTIEELLHLNFRNTVLDPFSTLISRDVAFGDDNIIYPGVLISCEKGECEIGSMNVFHSDTDITVSNGGRLLVANNGVFGFGGAQILANRPGVTIVIGDEVRLAGGAELMGNSHLGRGAQILGRISAVDVNLAGGEPFTVEDPDRRGAVLKGFGRANGIKLDQGEVVNGSGDFRSFPIEQQSIYHPRNR